MDSQQVRDGMVAGKPPALRTACGEVTGAQWVSKKGGPCPLRGAAQLRGRGQKTTTLMGRPGGQQGLLREGSRWSGARNTREHFLWGCMAGLTCMDLWSETWVGPGCLCGGLGGVGAARKGAHVPLPGTLPIRDPWFLHRLGQDRGWGASGGTVF